MADYNSSLPVRTEQSGDVAVKLVDKTTVSQAASVDASGNVSTLVNNSTVSPVNSQDAADGPVSPGTAATKSMLTGAVFNTASPTLTNGQQCALQLDNSGRLIVVTSGAATEATLAKLAIAQGTALGSNSGPLMQAAVSTAAPSYTSGQISPLSLTTAGLLRVDIGAGFSQSNPFPVYLSDSPGTEVNDYNTAASVAANATSNHDYTVTAAKTLRMTQIVGAGSGKIKIEVQVESGVATGVFATKFVGFNSTSTPMIILPLSEMLSVAAGVRVRLIRTNLDKSSADIYSTICGHEQ